MIFLLTGSPRPVPVGLVVKKGSKILVIWSGGIPAPVSSISAITMVSPGPDLLDAPLNAVNCSPANGRA